MDIVDPFDQPTAKRGIVDPFDAPAPVSLMGPMAADAAAIKPFAAGEANL